MFAGGRRKISIKVYRKDNQGKLLVWTVKVMGNNRNHLNGATKKDHQL